jgi:peptidoglycan/LPS O-acetylase OafA/YrhL
MPSPTDKLKEVTCRSPRLPTETRKPARLDALTGLRCFAAVNIVLFHFSNPHWFGILAPIVNSGYISVSYFIMLSGFVLGYNYSDTARRGEFQTFRFWEARFTRLFPIYLLSLLLAWRMVSPEYHAHTHFLFWTGVVLTPVMLQGWIPSIATFLNTPAWTISAEAFYYFLFPWMARWKRPSRLRIHLAKMFGVWMLSLVPGALYMIFNPDGISNLDRWSYGPWLQGLKYTPLPHLPGFVFGVMLADVDQRIGRDAILRPILGVFGFVATFAMLFTPVFPYALLHDGLLMPLFGCIVLGLAGENRLASGFSWRPLVFIGEASYCLYLLHFNLWNLIHDSGLLRFLHVARFDPWISYIILIALALLALHLIEKPAQRQLRTWLRVWR